MSRNRIEQHPDQYREDLNPSYTAGENYGPKQHEYVTAHDIKDLHDRLHQFRDDQLKQIPILAEGSRLEQGAVYLDLQHPERGDFKALGGMVAGRENWYVPKDDVDYQLWNLLKGVDNWDRLGDLVPEGDE